MPLAPPGVESWTPDLFVAANLVFLLGLYLVSARRARTITGTPWPVLRTISFAAAVLILAVAYLGPFTAWAHPMFWP
ncbi:MAG: cytochrome c oxidase assembly protein, partial [Candidatus Nanopelagicales bacterium]